MALADVLPPLNASLNALCATLLVFGRRKILAGEKLPHGRLMLGALGTSAVFLVSYLTRVALTGATRFVGAPWLRATYLLVLGSHTLLAALVVPLVFRTWFLAVKGRFVEHRRWARWTWPVWMYVSVTGVVVYVMLYHLAEARIPIGR